MNKPSKTPKLPSFENIEQLMADEYLLGRVQEKIDFINSERKRVSEDGKKKLKPSPVESLVKMNKFTANFIASEYVKIHYKKSSLNSSLREFITYTMYECVDETFNHYEKLFAKQNKKNSKTNPNGEN